MNDVLYLDYNASTPVDPRVVQAMLPFFSSTYANPTSRSHRPGRDAFTAFEEARKCLVQVIGANSSTEIVFTGSATEASNLALLGTALASPTRRHLITQATEHPSVLEPLRHLEKRGYRLTVIGVDEHGIIDLGQLEQAIDDDTALVSVMLANNETGTVQPVRAAADITHRMGATLHCDAAQAVGKIPVAVDDLAIDLMSISAHKLYGPKGVGALYLRRGGARPEPCLFGGGQEAGLRPGTLNLPGAVGLARAATLADELIGEEGPRLERLRNRLEELVLQGLDEVFINGAQDARLPSTTNLSFAGIDGNALLASLPDLAVSTGSACSSTQSEPSPVLLAMGLEKDLIKASIRISVGRPTSDDDIDRAAERLVTEVKRLRAMPRQRRSRNRRG